MSEPRNYAEDARVRQSIRQDVEELAKNLEAKVHQRLDEMLVRENARRAKAWWKYNPRTLRVRWYYVPYCVAYFRVALWRARFWAWRHKIFGVN
jgi:hypothetical protein